ncbi:30S ribosomal protein S1 [Streptococcus mutans N66]|uniref:S1 RNA-binding domain-containing protein n=1 Tax=Streptococcus mutans TaxID=1309 RepID=UPI0002B5488B|nr:S1 RNA-binding domain-containing protein [Streptococcus mutans]EMC15061.1 30S ribosomal protein S1 [Streptococcus mutans N66]
MNEFEDLLNSVSEVNPGDVVTAEVLTVDGEQANLVIDGTGVEAVLTLRELTNDRNADINDFVKAGDKVEVLVLRQVVGKDTDTVTFLVSKKRLEARKAWDKLVGREGDVVTGTVARLTSFGAFIDLGGVDGLVHITELSHERNVSPKSVVTVGEEIQVKVLAIDEEAGRVSLSLKATTPGPWDGVEQKLAAGDVIEGKVKRLTDFGAFVEVLPGIDGLVHISQISHKRVENPKDVLSVGQDVTVKVLDVNTADERVSLSIKALEERPAQDESNGEKRQSRPRRQKRQDKRDYELPETQTGFSMADLFGDIEL